MADFYVTDTAAKRFAEILGHPLTPAGLTSARRMLAHRMAEMRITGTDPQHREQWRHTRTGMRAVVLEGRVLWVGRGRPPARLWEQVEAPRAADAKTVRSRRLAADATAPVPAADTAIPVRDMDPATLRACAAELEFIATGARTITTLDKFAAIPASSPIAELGEVARSDDVRAVRHELSKIYDPSMWASYSAIAKRWRDRAARIDRSRKR